MKTTMTLLSRFDLAQQWTVTDNFLYFSILSRWISWSTVSKSHSGQAEMKRLFFFALFSLELTSLKNWSSKGQRRLNFPHLQWRINPNSVVRPRVSLRSISAWLHANMKQAQAASAFLLPAAVFSITVNYIVSLRCELIRALPCHILNEMYFAAAFVFFSASSFISTRLHLTSNSPSSFHGLVFRLTASVWQNKRKKKNYLLCQLQSRAENVQMRQKFPFEASFIASSLVIVLCSFLRLWKSCDWIFKVLQQLKETFKRFVRNIHISDI